MPQTQFHRQRRPHYKQSRDSYRLKTALETSSSNMKVRGIVTEDSDNLAYDSGDYMETVTQTVTAAKVEVQRKLYHRLQAPAGWKMANH